MAGEQQNEYDIRTVDALRAVIGDEVPGLAEKNLAKLDRFGARVHCQESVSGLGHQ